MSRLFLDVMGLTAETTHSRSSLLYTALVTHLCYEANVRTRISDTYLVTEVPLGATSLAKSTGALGAQASKRRCATIVEGAEEGELAAVGPSDDPSLIAPGPEFARLERLILMTQGEMCQIES